MRRVTSLLLAMFLALNSLAQPPQTTQPPRKLEELNWQLPINPVANPLEDDDDEVAPEEEETIFTLAEISLKGSKPKLALPNILMPTYKPAKLIVVSKRTTKKTIRVKKCRKCKARKKVVRRTRIIKATPDETNFLAAAKKETHIALPISSAYRSKREQLSLARRNRNAAAVSGPLRSAHDRAAIDIPYKNMSQSQREKFEEYLMTLWTEKGSIIPTKEFVQKCYHIVVLPKDLWSKNLEWVRAVISHDLANPILLQSITVWNPSITSAQK